MEGAVWNLVLVRLFPKKIDVSVFEEGHVCFVVAVSQGKFILVR